MEKKIEIKSITEYISKVVELSEIISNNHILFYRGQSSQNYKFQASIDRYDKIFERVFIMR